MTAPAFLRTPDAAQATLAKLRKREPLLWLNPDFRPEDGADGWSLDPAEAIARLQRQAPVMRAAFAQLEETDGRLQSPLTAVPRFRQALVDAPVHGASHPAAATAPAGTWWIKRDDALPVAGSIKARGGFHEVIALAERLVREHGVQGSDNAVPVIDSQEARALFASHTVAVGSTGNLGLSIGLIATALGFRSVVHMSRDAKPWKKDRLRRHGIEVMEHDGDYAVAVSAGRNAAERDTSIHFVDDEHSRLLFLGYAAAAEELAAQLVASGVVVDATHPLFVYLPCGVGGAPGGIAYGLKRRYGAHVHCFFAEPAASPCMLVQLLSGLDRPVSVYDVGLDNRTEADGLAVAQASMLVAPIMQRILSGVLVVSDDMLLEDTYLLAQTEGISVEPSAAAAFRGPAWLQHSAAGQDYLAQHGLTHAMGAANHVLWSTGGSLVPEQEQAGFQARGKALHLERTGQDHALAAFDAF
ncbi:MAG: D-serine ammonia-lyase [Comamonadaceae bacterium]|nr:MAG: D-serine ammonia-lyase [Comamonadaceae bacterium]